MLNLTPEILAVIVAEAQKEGEVTRRAEAYKRHLIFKDGGERFLLEQVRREFDELAVREMRLAPINLLKKIVKKRASIYKRAPVRRAGLPADQKLVDYYAKEMRLDQGMQKANRYFVLHANTTLYVRPESTGKLCLNVSPPYQYSLFPDPLFRDRIDAFGFSAFTERGRLFNSTNQPAATGREGFTREAGFETPGQKIDSEQLPMTNARNFVFWTDKQHCTTDEKGQIVPIKDDSGGEQGIIEHGLGICPVVNLAQDRDNEAWAIDGEDLIKLTMALQLGWSDVLTIAKQQGFGQLTVVSENRPEKLVLGINKAIWLKAERDGVKPELDFKSSSSSLGEYRQLLTELLGLLLSTNDMNPKSIGGSMSTQNVTSGFQALIEMADTLEAVESDKPALMDAETALWEVIAAWHNKWLEAGKLPDDAKALGKFSEKFSVAIMYQDAKPLESEKERLDVIKEMRDLGLITRKRAMKKLYPELDEKQLEEEMKLIDVEKQAQVTAINEAMGAKPAVDPNADPANDGSQDPAEPVDKPADKPADQKK